MEENKHWQSFGQRDGSEAFKQLAEDEFQESLPFEADDSGFLDAKTPRRDFLKYLGFSTAAAALVASCEMPVRKSIPFLNKPEDIIPGVANYYATTFVQDGDVIPVLAKVRDGRPIKIEGNDMSSLTQGATSARVQASVLSLYDVNRLRFPKMEGNNEATFEAVDKRIAQALADNGSKPIVLLTSSIVSPTVKTAIAEFTKKYPNTKQVTYDAVSYHGLLKAAETTYGKDKRIIPSYQFDKAKVIVSIDADFLGTWLSPVAFARQYGQGRRITDDNTEMSRHFQFEGNYSMTGANADERYTYKPSEIGAVVLGLYEAVGGSVSAPSITNERLKTGIAQAALELKAAGGKALVVSGSNDVNVQIIVNAINEKIGANGVTVDWANPVNYRQGNDEDMVQLVDDMNAGSVGAVFVFGPNPAYTYFAADKFVNGLKKVPLTVSFPISEDETASLCKFILPVHHYLESWGDAELRSGYISFQQPTISPLFKTRHFATSLLKWSGNDKDYETYFKDHWVGELKSLEAFELAIQNGILEPGQTPAIGSLSFNTSSVSAAASGLSTGKTTSGIEVVLYQTVAVGDGAMANNPWLQEMPDPITRITWDNYAILSPKLAESFGIKANDSYEVEINKPVIEVKVGSQSYKLAAIIIPGVHPEVVGIALGYGRDPKIGRAGGGVGQNAYPLVGFAGGSFTYSTSAEVSKTAETYKIAQTQLHNVYEGRTSVVKESTLATFKKTPEVFQQLNKELSEEYGGDYRKNGTLYKDEDVYDRFGIAWGMSVDLNACIGCGACTVACTAENNVSVVGKTQVAKAHAMHWIRIDRYFSGDMENPDVVFQPMMCQHCDNAPCENVCPVNATNHSSEGLNQMAYNRCIGTRYCANNCPFKVRRFNWYDWNGADSFPDNQQPVVDEGWLNPVIMDMNDPLTRMVLNPDVTVRSRGVMEKCSFCVQRLQEGKLNAKKDSRPLRDGEVKTACMQACPTQAIIFGNVNDKQSKIFSVRNKENKNRMYHSLEELHVLPNVNYLAKVRNTPRAVGMTMDEQLG